MSLTIQNFDKIKGMIIQTMHARWSVEGVHENELAYCIKIKFKYGQTMGKKHPEEVDFYLNRHCPIGFDSYLLQDTYFRGGMGLPISKRELGHSAGFIKKLKEQLDKI